MAKRRNNSKKTFTNYMGETKKIADMTPEELESYNELEEFSKLPFEEQLQILAKEFAL